MNTATPDRKTLSAIDNARLSLNNAAMYLITKHKIKPWQSMPLAPPNPDVEAFKMLCGAISHTYTRCLVCSDDAMANWGQLAHCEFCDAPLCDHCYEDHWKECEATAPYPFHD